MLIRYADNKRFAKSQGQRHMADVTAIAIVVCRLIVLRHKDGFSVSLAHHLLMGLGYRLFDSHCATSFGFTFISLRPPLPPPHTLSKLAKLAPK